MTRFEIHESTLYGYIKIGLPVYDVNFDKIKNPKYFTTKEISTHNAFVKEFEMVSILTRKLGNIDGSNPIFFDDICNKEEETAYDSLNRCWFNIKEYLNFISPDKESEENIESDSHEKIHYMDEAHNFFCIELKAAVEVWTAIFTKEEQSSQSAKRKIHKWLTTEYKKLPENAIGEKDGRIVLIVNPDCFSGGGATKTDNQHIIIPSNKKNLYLDQKFQYHSTELNMAISIWNKVCGKKNIKEEMKKFDLTYIDNQDNQDSQIDDFISHIRSTIKKEIETCIENIKTNKAQEERIIKIINPFSKGNDKSIPELKIQSNSEKIKILCKDYLALQIATQKKQR